ncbi:MAG: LamG-like jellyroll fold domain-containing protein, partial [Candidatus Aenigmatarchaeota archaeon]
MEIKGISTVIASVLMLMIVIALAGTAYLYISGTFTSKTATTFEIIESVNDTVTIRNSGTEAITNIKATLDGGDVNIAVVPNIQGLVGYWSFNEGSGSTTADNSGNGNVGTLFNNPTWVDGKFGKALSFDGSNDYVEVPDSQSLRISSYSVAVWIKPQVDDDYWTGIVGKPGRNFNIWLGESNDPNGGYIHHRFHSTGGGWNDGCPDTDRNAIKMNTWNFVVITNDGINCKTYVFNTETYQVSGTVSGNLVVDNTNLQIGRNLDGGNGNYFSGIIDEVRIYNRALSESEIKQLHSGLVSPGQT